MFRRRKDDRAPEGSGSAGDAAPTMVLEDAGAPPEPAAAEAVPADAAETDGGPGYVGDHLPPRLWVESVLDTRPPPTRDELERQAAADFQAAIAPSLAGLQQAVPDASSPEDARQVLEDREQQTEFLPDTEGELLRGRDVFAKEASVHYRIQRHLERRRRRVGWGEPWRPPAGLARPASASSRPSLGPGRE